MAGQKGFASAGWYFNTHMWHFWQACFKGRKTTQMLYRNAFFRLVFFKSIAKMACFGKANEVVFQI